MAIVCCATPSQLYLEETRSTLAFAARAKLVKTNAKVNEVLDDRSLIRRLQKELAEARRDMGKTMDHEHLRALKQQAATAGTAAQKAEEKLRRIQKSLINSAMWISDNGTEKVADGRRKKRRYSDGQHRGLLSPSKCAEEASSNQGTMTPGRKKMRRHETFSAIPEVEVEATQMFRKALLFKSSTVETLNEKTEELRQLLISREKEIESLKEQNNWVRDNYAVAEKKYAEKLESMTANLESTREQKRGLETEQIALGSKVETLEANLVNESKSRKDLSTEHEILQQNYTESQEEALRVHQELEDTKYKLIGAEQTRSEQLADIELLKRKTDESSNKLQLSETECKDLREEVKVLRDQLVVSNTTLNELQETSTRSREESELREQQRLQLIASLEVVQKEKADLSHQLSQSEDHVRTLADDLDRMKKEMQETQIKAETTITTISLANEHLVKEMEEKAASSSMARSMSEKLEQELGESSTLLRKAKDQEEILVKKLESTVVELESTKEAKSSIETEQLRLLSELATSATALEEESRMKETLTTEIERLRQDLELVQTEASSSRQEMQNLQEQLKERDRTNVSLKGNIERLERSLDETTNNLRLSQVECENRTEEMLSLCDQLDSSKTKVGELEEGKKTLKEDFELREDELTESITCLGNEKADLSRQLDQAREHAQGLSEQLQATNEHLRDSENESIAKIETLSMENGNLRKEVEAKDASLSEATSATDLAVQELQETTALLQIVKDREESTANKLHSAIAELESTREEKSAHETEQARLIAELESSVAKLEEESILKQSLSTENERFRQEFELIQNELDKTRNELLDVKEELIQSQNNISKLQSDKERVERTIEEAMNDLELARTELVSLRDQLTSSNTRIKELQQTSNKFKEDYESREGELTESIILLENEKTDLSRQLEGARDHAQELSQELEATNKQLRDSEKDTIAKIETLSMENGNLRKEVEAKDAALSEATSATDLAVQELQQTTALLQSLKDREESTANNLNSMIAELDSTREEKSALETEQARLFAELESSVAKLEEESILKQSLSTENERFRQEFELIQNELDKTRNELYDVKEELIQSQNNTSNLQSDKERVERTIEEAMNDLELARTELVSLRDQLSSSNTRIEEFQQTTNKFKEDYELRERQQTESIILLENEKADLSRQLEGANDHAQELSQELEATNKQLRDSEKDTIAKIETLSMENGNLRKEVEAKDVFLSEATSATDLAVQELQETTALLQSLKDREESTANELNSAIAELDSTREEKSALETEQARLVAELESSVAKLEEESILKQSLYTENERFRQNVELIQNELDKTRNELLDVKEELIQSQNNTSNLQSDKERVERTIEEATNDLVSLRDQLSSSNTRIEELQQTSNKFKEDHELREGELTESIILLENEKADLSRQLEGARDHAQELSQELEATNKLLRDSEKDTIAKIETLSMENGKLRKEVEVKNTSMSEATSATDLAVQELQQTTALVQSLKEREESTANKLKSSIAELQSTRDEKAALETEQTRLFAELESSVAKLEEESILKQSLSTENERFRQDVELIQNELDTTRNELYDVKEELIQSQNITSNLQSDKESVERTIEEATNDLVSLRDQLSSSNTRIEELQQTNNKFKEDYELREGELTESIILLENEKADLSGQLEGAKGHAQELSQELEATNKQLRDSEKDTIAKIETLSMENGNLRKEVEAKDVFLSEATSATDLAVQELQQTTALLQVVKDREERTANKLNSAIAELESTREEKSALETEQARLFAELESSVAKLEEESILKQSLSTENERFRQEFELIQNELDKTRSELLDVKEELIQSQNNTSNLQSDKERVERTIEETTNDLELARTELVSLRDQLTSSNTRIKELQQTSNKFKEDHELRERQQTESIILHENEKADLSRQLEGAKDHAQELSQVLEATNKQLRDSEKDTIAKIETLSMENGNLRKEVEAKDAALSEATSATDLAVQELQQTTALLQSVKDREESTANNLNSAIAELDSTREEKSALETEQARLFAELESSVAKLEEESILKQSLSTENERFRQEFELIQNELDKTRNELYDVKEELIQSQNNTSNLQSDKERIERTIEEATNDLELARTELVSLRDQLSYSNTRIEEFQQTTNKFKEDYELRERQQTESIILLENEKADLSRQLEGAKDHAQELSQELGATNKQLRDSEKDTIAKIETLSMENGNLRKEVEAKDVFLSEATSATDLAVQELQQTTALLQSVKDREESTANNRNIVIAELESTKEQKSSVELERSQLLSELEISVASLEEVSKSRDALSTENVRLQQQFEASCHNLNDAKEQVSVLRSENDMLEKNLEDKTNNLALLHAECEEKADELVVVCTQLDSSDAMLSDFRKTHARLQEESKLHERELLESIASLKKETNDLSHQLDQSREHTRTLNDDLDQTKKQMRESSSEAKITSKKLSIDNEKLMREIEAKTAALLEVQSTINRKEALLQRAKDEEENLSERLESTIADLESTKAQNASLKMGHSQLLSELKISVSSLEEESQSKQDLSAEIDRLRQDIEISQDEAKRAGLAVVDVETKLRDVEKTAYVLRSEKDILQQKLEETTSKLTMSKAECKDRADELISLHDLLESSNASSAELRDANTRLKEQFELREVQLLESISSLGRDRVDPSPRVNQSVDNARILSADLEHTKLHQKQNEAEQKLESALKDNEKLRDELESTKSYLSEVKSAFERTTREHDLETVLPRSAEERLQSKNTKVHESSLSGSSVSVAEADHWKVECDMLKSKADKMDKALSQMKSQMEEEKRNIIREAAKDVQGLRESLRRSESDAYAAREMISDLQDERAHNLEKVRELESKAAAIENENTRMQRSARRVEKDKDSQIENLRSDLRRLRTEIGDTTRREALSEEKARHLEQKLAQSEDVIQTKTREINALQELTKTQTKTEDVKHLQEENSGLRDYINDLSRNLSEVEARVKKASSSSSDANRLQSEVQSLLQQLASKDERIQKLEKVKLTKEKAENFRRTKKENEENKKKLEAAEHKIAELMNQSASVAQEEQAEMASVRFAKEALESKVRKFAAHCQRLEDEKADIRRALLSSNVTEVKDHDIAASVVALSDRINSLQQPLTHGLADGSESQSLRQKNSQLMDERDELRKKAEAAAQSEAETRQSLLSLRRENEELNGSIALAGHEAETRSNVHVRKIQYLEQENLKLITDLKELRRSIQRLKAENNTLRNESVDNQIPSRFASSENALKQSRRINAPDKDRGTDAFDKENRSTSSPMRSNERTRRGPAPLDTRPSSTKKRQVPGLGQAFEPHDENTQECQQS